MAKPGSKTSQANGASADDFATHYADFGKMSQDFTKFLSGGRVFDTDAIVSGQRKFIQAFTAANQVAFEGVQAVMRRQVEIARQTAEDMAQVVKEMTGAGTPEDKLAKQAQAVKEAFESYVANVREISELVQKSGNEAVDVLSECVCENLDHISHKAKTNA